MSDSKDIFLYYIIYYGKHTEAYIVDICQRTGLESAMSFLDSINEFADDTDVNSIMSVLDEKAGTSPRPVIDIMSEVLTKRR